jgi:hypothetical protein
MLLTIKPTFIRPRVTLRAKKDKFVEPAEAPGEGKRRPPDENDTLSSRDDIGGRERIQITQSPEPKEVEKPHPLKKFIMDVFKIEEIDYEEFRKKSKWAIRPNKKD